MSYQRLHIKSFLKGAENNLVIDVRSPSEYNQGHIIHAKNIPLFTDEERKIVGTTYKQESRRQAIKIGLDFFGPKMKKIVEEVEELMCHKQLTTSKDADNQLPIALYCWRGGMRSAAIAWLLNLYGFEIKVLSGGYKAYRNHVLETFSLLLNLKVIAGFTGSGKTEILHELEKKGEAIIDLEKLASHKGSAFGNINLPAQPTQEMFENFLANEIIKCISSPLGDGGVIWLEDESQRIGLINIPPAFWQQMRRAPVYFFSIPFEERLKHIVEEYGNCDKGLLAKSILRISKRLGGLETKNALNYLDEGNISGCFSILLKYYDKHYLKGLHNRDNLASLLHKLPGIAVNPNNAAMLTANSISV
ncbi:MAG: tRNA 2-selenouridine(34) synthase MnmH [Chitinophagaceae bacterium]